MSFMNKVYTIDIAGLKRNLPLCEVTPELHIAAFVMLGDTEITVVCARELLKLAPEFDVIVTAEAKGIPLAYEMAKLSCKYKYIIARKGEKVYMRDAIVKEVTSITTRHRQTLYLDGAEGEYMCGKRVLIVDDVISTGESLSALESLVTSVGGKVACKMAVLAEGDAARRDDIVFLAPLPLFDGNGEIIK